jgi:hypothetical protein
MIMCFPSINTVNYTDFYYVDQLYILELIPFDYDV